MSNIAILLLAAGASSRMAGRDKLSEEVEGQPLLALMCRRAALTGLPVYVTVPNEAHPRTGLTGTATPVPVPDADEGMAASIRRGVTALPETTEGVMIVPADMPELETQDLMHMAAHFHGGDGPILRATAEDGQSGHPVLFPKRCFADLEAITGDQGARVLLKQDKVQYIALPARHATTDLDTPEAWAAWRAARV
ncbi:MAG: nucleotidyltransferase family protein [Pseudophaeobacter sp. bin_em_oilr2.035]|uniref:Nucleotidyltransferase family protein n=2 Tax=Phaeobacter gallaeciensis TaxID=60890 RepID=A0ABD4X4Y9_9RHOB|nr:MULTISPECIES: nucleotidyltransferase family protein [Phaeobacter]MDF1772797.1 nucleotidyltransferase family protein [Pseudophaeobacter sp. bin_em_oilr2.035]MEE2632782.1 nucleotidyltransferase family protein [Pseudomonadota bacterium]MDE4061479.1 nucleotidyltransferase family protein [Phaeobacter gallaeciensis]MDE4124499.1 nucleotidyltransferase family protein [Phaeobacter gallaeciensis]MDE4129077.1 nucleotidyltransferase family protein [Phaeobacter gallaeciensis]